MRISDWSSDVCSSDLKIFAELCPVLKKDAILATNTSSISVTRLASSTDRPEKFMGMHFMNPVPVMALVELIRGIAPDEETRSEEHTSELQSLMRTSYAVFCLQIQTNKKKQDSTTEKHLNTET